MSEFKGVVKKRGGTVEPCVMENDILETIVQWANSDKGQQVIAASMQNAQEVTSEYQEKMSVKTEFLFEPVTL